MTALFALLALQLAVAPPARIIEPLERSGSNPKSPPAQFGLWTITGGIPEKRVRDWIKIHSIGSANHPWSILYFAPQPLHVTGYPEFSYALPIAEYRALASFTMAQSCKVKAPTRNEIESSLKRGGELDWGIFQIDRSINGVRQRPCILLQRENCAYFDHLAEMPIRWTRENVYGVANMARTLHCSPEQAAKWSRVYKAAVPKPS